MTYKVVVTTHNDEEGKAQRKCRKQVNGVNVSILRGIKSERQTANEALAEKEMNNIF